jgi:hypothetical protein
MDAVDSRSPPVRLDRVVTPFHGIAAGSIFTSCSVGASGVREFAGSSVQDGVSGASGTVLAWELANEAQGA